MSTVWITVIAVIAAINALIWLMVLIPPAGRLSGGVYFIRCRVLAYELEFYAFFMAVIVVILFFVLFNLGYLGKLRKVFGDAGKVG
ncbi:hypothetical protein OK016_10510 [Vibrio chagasii]|nr:hypothetical protein [Vibrio chagasii]